MIKHCNNIDDIILLWHEAFGDNAEEIRFFSDNVRDADCLMYYENDEPGAMMYLVSCMADGRACRYIYAACTAKKFRGRGFMTALIDYCIESKIAVCLIPAEDSLVDFYTKRKISRKIPVESIEFNQSEEIIEYLLEGYELTEPTALISEEM